MSYKGPGRKIHTSNRGVPIDMDTLRAGHENAIAVTGAGSVSRMNARGDHLTIGGRVQLSREQLEAQYNREPQGAVKQVGLKQLEPDTFETPQQVMERLQQAMNTASTPAVDAPTGVVDRRQARKMIDKND